MSNKLNAIVLLVLFVLCFVNMACGKNDEADTGNGKCTHSTLVDADMYNNFQSAQFTFIDAEIVDDCLNLEIGASGCDSKTWSINLVDSGAVAESHPEQRYLKLQLFNEEDCLAYFTKTVSFDLMPVRVSGSNEIILRLEGLEASLNYEY